MVTDVPLYGSQIDEAGALHNSAVSCVVGSHQVDMNVRAVRRPEVREAKNATAVPNMVNGCVTHGKVHYPMKCSGRKRLFGWTAFRGREFLMDAMIDDKTLRPKMRTRQRTMRWGAREY